MLLHDVSFNGGARFCFLFLVVVPSLLFNTTTTRTAADAFSPSSIYSSGSSSSSTTTTGTNRIRKIAPELHGALIDDNTATPAAAPAVTTAATRDEETRPIRVAVIGGGWAGYSFCESISTNNINMNINMNMNNNKSNSAAAVEIILLDASATGKGGLAGGYRTKGNRPAEAGIHGFWREYRNTFSIMQDIQGVNVNSVLGDFTPSVLFSKNGRVALAPVLGDDETSARTSASANKDKKAPSLLPINIDSIRKNLAANLPPPLDLPLLAEFDSTNTNTNTEHNNRLQLIDLISAIGLLGAWADFQQESNESWNNYDSLPATELFRKAGITDVLYEELVSPLLHVLPMCPAYDCSAAAALSCFHVFALQSRGAFDVRWCKGSISEKIFDPWQIQLEQRGVEVRGGARVTGIEECCTRTNDGDSTDNDGYKYSLSLESFSDKSGSSAKETLECDAIVLAVGATSMSKIAASSPLIASLPASKDFDKLRGVTCVAVRLFLQPHPSITSDLKGGVSDKTQLPPDVARAMKDSPVAVCGAGMGGIVGLEETGFCIYDLQRMHDEFRVDRPGFGLDGDDAVAVLEVDFYRADDIANLNDDEVAKIALDAVSAAFGTKTIGTDCIVDKAVVRARNAVSHFAPKSALYSPNVKLGDNLYVCGDWIDRTGHASWSTEKSVVTAKQAAAVFSTDLGLLRSKCDVIPAAKDTAQLSALRQSARVLRSIVAPATAPPSPWVFLKQLLSGEKII